MFTLHRQTFTSKKISLFFIVSILIDNHSKVSHSLFIKFYPHLVHPLVHQRHGGQVGGLHQILAPLSPLVLDHVSLQVNLSSVGGSLSCSVNKFLDN